MRTLCQLWRFHPGHGRTLTMMAIALLITNLPPIAFAETHVCGIIDHTVRWTAEASPYIINDDIVVTRKARLVIAPGARILIGRPRSAHQRGKQFDRVDSSTVSITIRGMLNCVGKPDRRIVFAPLESNGRDCAWFGIIFDSAYSELAEIAYADIAGACCAVTVRGCSPLVRTTVLEYNTLGVRCIDKGNIRLYNCVIAHNTACGVRVEASNPAIYNNIITRNRNNGVWCDGIAKIDFRYNCVFDNGDGNLLDCDPEWGVLCKVNKNKDSTDAGENLYCDPVFAGSPGDSAATERDITLPTDKSRVADTVLAKTLHKTLSDSLAISRRRGSYPRFALSRYSPCIDAGHLEKRFRDIDGSRNDMGIWGGPEYLAQTK